MHTSTATTKGATPMTTRTTRKSYLDATYVERVNAAAGTDIAMLEDAWMAALLDEDFAEAGRLEDIVMRARRAAGY